MLSVLDKLGQGTFGKCFLVADENESDDHLFALKRSKVTLRGTNQKEPKMGRESEVHTHLQKLDQDGGYERHIATLCGQFCSQVASRKRKRRHPLVARNLLFRHVHYISCDTRFQDEQDLGLLLQKNNLSCHQIAHMANKVLQALSYLHRNNVVHRDLKPSNILVNPKTLNCRLCDLGAAKIKGSNKEFESSPLVCALLYRAPEIVLGARMYGPAIDLWSLGIIFLELMLDVHPLGNVESVEECIATMFSVFGKPSEREQQSMRIPCKQLKVMHKMPCMEGIDFCALARNLNRQQKRWSSDGIQFARSLCNYNPGLRPSAEQSMKHTFFDDVLSS